VSIHGHCDIFRGGRSFFLTATLVRARYSKAAPMVDCERKSDYSSYEFMIDLDKPKYGITDRKLSMYHYERIRFLMYKNMGA